MCQLVWPERAHWFEAGSHVSRPGCCQESCPTEHQQQPFRAGLTFWQRPLQLRPGRLAKGYAFRRQVQLLVR